MDDCKVKTAFKIVETLGVSIDQLVGPYLEERCSFETFKSAICHRVKNLGDLQFIIDTLERDDIRRYFNRGWYPESLYLLAMLDYLSRINEIQIYPGYDDLRNCKLSEPLYPASLELLDFVTKDKDLLKEAEQTAIPEFTRFNIIEDEIRNVV